MSPQALFIIGTGSACAASVWASAALLGTHSQRNVSPGGRTRQVLGAVAGFPIVVILIEFLLGATGRLTAPGAVGLAVLAAIAAATLAWRSRSGGTGILPVTHRRDACATGTAVPHAIEAPEPDQAEFLMRFLAIVLLAAIGWGVVWNACLGGRFYGDDLSYHGPAAAHWVVGGRLSLSPFSYHAYFPLGAELFSAWFMLPFHSDAVVRLSGAYWAGLAVVAAVCLCLELGAKRSAALLVGVALLATPDVRRQAEMFAAVDLAGAALLLAALVFAVPRAGVPQRTRLVEAAYCGLLAGLAAGCKVTFVPIAVLLCLWLAFASRAAVARRTRLASAGVFALAALAAGGYWYIRNVALTGNPLFPAAVGPLGGPFGADEQWRTRLVSWILKAPKDVKQWLFLAKAHIEWPTGLFVLAAAGYAGALWRMLRRGASADSPAAGLRRLLLAVGLLLLLIYPLTPFSGTNNNPVGELRIALRFLLAPFAIGLALFSPLVEGSLGRRAFWFSLGVFAAMCAWPGAAGALFAAAAAGGCLLAAERVRIYGLLRGVLMLAFLAFVAFWAAGRKPGNDALWATAGGADQPIGPAWQAVRKLPSGSRIAWFGPAAYRYYPLFGPSLLLVPCAVTEEGRLRPPLHARWRENPDECRWWEPPEPKLDALVANLRAAAIDYVLVTKYDGTEWPPQQRVLAASGQARAVYDDGYSTVWRLAPR